MRAMVIDDSRAMRVILGRLLTELGFHVTEAADGGEAMDRLAKLDVAPDLALVDWNMPNVNGLEFVKRVRAEGRYARMRLMMVTTESEIERVVAALSAGANEYLMKPFTREAVLEKLRLLELA